jgi:cation/acetate symporter
MLAGGLFALIGITLTSVSDVVLQASLKNKTANPLAGLETFWVHHPMLRIVCEQPAIWTVPLAICLMIIVSKLTSREIPSDVRMKMLVLHAPEQLGLKQEYIQEHQALH